MTKDITLSGTWQPIGYSTTTAGSMFSGSFNGNGKTISGLYVSGNYSSPTDPSKSGEKTGFFGTTQNATIKNLTLKGSGVSGTTCVGSLVGFSKGNLTVDNCHSSVNVTASGANAGGLIGDASEGTGWDARGLKVSNSSYSGTIYGKARTGGIVGSGKRAFGYESDPMITRCKTSGTVSGSSDVGGIVGEAYGTITQCYSTGYISGSSSNVGGIAGNILASGNPSSANAIDYSGYVYDSYSLGDISGSSCVGGIVGQSYETANSPASGVRRAYAVGSINSFQAGYTGGIVGKFTNTSWGSIGNCAILSPRITQKGSTKTTVQPFVGMKNHYGGSSYYRSDITLIANGNTVSSHQTSALPLSQMKLLSTYTSLGWSIGDNKTWKWNATLGRPELNIDPIVLTLSEKTIDLKEGEMMMLTATPSLTSNKWWSEDPSVATVVSGLVTGVKEGETTIWVQPTIGNAVACTVLVTKLDLGHLTLEVTLEQGQTTQLSAFRNYDDKSEVIKPIWDNSNPSVVSIDATGLVTALDVGSTIITATNPEIAGQVEMVYIKVVPSFPVTGIDIIPTTLDMAIGQNMGIEYEINPNNANNQRVIWYSSNENVVTVENGIISAVASGAATVGAVTVDGGFTDTVSVYVEYSVSEIEVTPEDAIVVEGDELQMYASSVPAEPTPPSVTWSSSDETIATINSSGVLTGISAGEVTITATSVNYEGISGSVVVTIREPIVETIADWSEFPLGMIPPYEANDGSYYQSSSNLTAVGNNIVVSRDSVNKIRATGWKDASDTNVKAWQASFETTGMKNIRFSTAQSANNNSPNNFVAEYSLNGAVWFPISIETDENGDSTSGYFIRTSAENAATQKQLSNILLPSECNDKLVVYVRLRAADSIGVAGAPVPNDTTPSFLHYFTVTGEH